MLGFSIEKDDLLSVLSLRKPQYRFLFHVDKDDKVLTAGVELFRCIPIGSVLLKKSSE